MNKLQAAEQFRKALQLFAMSLSDEQAMEVATVYDPWVAGKAYTTGEYFTYGENEVGDPQLYKVVQDHTSQEDWTPDVTASLYEPIGLDDNFQSYNINADDAACAIAKAMNAEKLSFTKEFSIKHL